MIDKYSAYWSDPTYGFNSYLANAGLQGYQLQDSDGTMQLFSPDGNRCCATTRNLETCEVSDGNT